MNVENAPITGEAIMFGNAAADLGSSIGNTAKDTGMMLYPERLIHRLSIQAGPVLYISQVSFVSG